MVEKVSSDIIVNVGDIDSKYLSPKKMLSSNLSKKNTDIDKATSSFLDKIKKFFATISLGMFTHAAVICNTKLCNKLNITKADLNFSDLFNIEKACRPIKNKFEEQSGLVGQGLYVYVAIIAPIVEEIIFRYGIQQKLLKDLPLKFLPEKYSKFVKYKLSTALRILITASLFAAFHLQNKAILDSDTVYSTLIFN